MAAAVSNCSASPSPCFALPIFVGPSSHSEAAAAATDASSRSLSSSSSTLPPVPPRVEQRLRALRRMSETSSSSRLEAGEDHAHSPAAPAAPRRRMSESALDRLEALINSAAGNNGDESDDAFTTPRIFHRGPLETPPTPGGRKRPVPVTEVDQLPQFIPVGIRGRATAAANAMGLTVTAPLPARWSSAPSSPKRLRTAPRYECPWLASFAAASMAAAEAKTEKHDPDEKMKDDSELVSAAAAEKASDDTLLGTLQNAARVLEISAGRSGGAAADDDDGKSVVYIIDDEDEEEDRPKIGHA